jgi:hypothetical protein
MRKNYVSPFIEVVEVEVEEGFAVSVEIDPKGTAHDFTTSSFGSAGGNTLDF